MEPQIYLLSLKQEIESALFSSLLSVVRKEKAERILAQTHKTIADTMLAGELLAMYAIRDVFGIPMSSQNICCDSHGKPYLSGTANVHFNISHSRNVVAAAVCDCPVGIDVEHIVPWRESLAKRICTPDEWECLQRTDDKEAALTRLWTQKEAVVKMKGVGLAGIRAGVGEEPGCFAGDAACVTERVGEVYVSCCTKRQNSHENSIVL